MTKDRDAIRERDKNMHQLSSHRHSVSSMPQLCLYHFSIFSFSHSDGGEPAITVKQVIVNNERVFPAHAVTHCQANKPCGFWPHSIYLQWIPVG